MTDFTIILPHRRNPPNDRSLEIALSCLVDNTDGDFKLLMDAATDKPLYARVNALVEQSTTECVAYMTSDSFAAPHWDTAMLSKWDTNTFVTGVVVEPGMIGVHHENLKIDFGRRPETFNRAAFETYAGSPSAHIPNGTGFPAPIAFPRSGWLECGGLETGLAGDHHGFTDADSYLLERWQARGGKLVRSAAFFYHLQRYSESDEQNRPERDE